MRASRSVRAGTGRAQQRSRAAKRPAARKRLRTERRAAQKQQAQRQRAQAHKRDARPRASKPVVKQAAGKPVQKSGVPLEALLHRFCKSGWAVLVERQPSQQGTRFVCPFCSRSHRVSGPVRGFRKVRRAQWIKLRRVDE
jgi:hypothetical protein